MKKTPLSPAAAASQGALLASLALVTAVVSPTHAFAQAPEATPGNSVTLAPIDVQAPGAANTQNSTLGISRLPASVQDTPQTVNVVSPEVMQQQNVTTIDQALRNVPGVTVSIGEGNGGQNGDQFRIRGFEARGDVYQDGLRDFGVYTRDSFNTEQVAVVKGPSGTAFGAGTVGGAIMLSGANARLGNFVTGTLSAGTGDLFRATAGANYQLNDTTAVRLNVMANTNKVVGRDNVGSDRWGVAPSISFGLGTDTTMTIAYLHQQDNRVPDYGVPLITRPGTRVGLPAPEFGVRRANWYGYDTDHDDTTADTLTVRFERKINDIFTLNSDSRVGFYSREFAATPVSCANVTTPVRNTCLTNLFDGRASTVPMVLTGGPGPYSQNTWGGQNVTTLTSRFSTGGLRHELVTGWDAWYQNDSRTSYTYAPSRSLSPRSLFNPSHAVNYRIVPNNASATANRDTDGTTFALFGTERVWLTPEFSLIGGLRWDNFETETETHPNGRAGVPVTRLSSTSNTLNWRAGASYEPTRHQNYYVSVSTSSSPAGQYITSAPNPLLATTADLDPEQNMLYEVGAKIGLLDGRIGLTGALFRIEKENARETNPLTGNILQSGDSQRNQGIEVGITGNVTRDWAVNANYTYLDSETTSSTTAANVGKRVQFVPRHSASLWTTYDVMRDKPTNFQIGLGATYRSEVYLNAANSTRAPDYLSFDAMVAHNFGDKWRMALNVYNIGDRLNYESLFSSRVIPSTGRTFILSLSANY